MTTRIFKSFVMATFDYNLRTIRGLQRLLRLLVLTAGNLKSFVTFTFLNLRPKVSIVLCTYKQWEECQDKFHIILTYKRVSRENYKNQYYRVQQLMLYIFLLVHLILQLYYINPHIYDRGDNTIKILYNKLTIKHDLSLLDILVISNYLVSSIIFSWYHLNNSSK